MQNFSIHCNFSFNESARETLSQAVSPHFIAYDEDLTEAHIAFGQPEIEAIENAPDLRWIHISSAGYTRYDSNEFRALLKQRDIIFTNSSHVFDEPCAQHVLAMMLGLSRQLPQSLRVQDSSRAWEGAQRRADSILLNGQTVMLLGYGAIAKRLIALLQPFAMNFIVVRRHPENENTDKSVRIIGENEIENFLPQVEHLVNCLPDTPHTQQFVNAGRLDLLPRGARFYNIGRGKTVDQNALLQALQNNLDAAYLDVTEPEPLPPSHPLWSAPNCFITPHSGGGHRGESERLIQHFIQNLRRFERNEPLIDRALQS